MTPCCILGQAGSSHGGRFAGLLSGQLCVNIQANSLASMQVRLASASSAFVGERYAVVCEVLDQFGGSFSGDPKCGTTADDTRL